MTPPSPSINVDHMDFSTTQHWLWGQGGCSYPSVEENCSFCQNICTWLSEIAEKKWTGISLCSCILNFEEVRHVTHHLSTIMNCEISSKSHISKMRKM